MKVEQWTIFFVLLLSFQFVVTVMSETSSAKEKFVPGSKQGSRGKRSKPQCSVSPEVTPIVDHAIDKCRRRISNRYELQDHTSTEIRLSHGFSEGWQNLVRSAPVMCTCSDRETLQVFLEINYLSVVLHYTLTLLDTLLGGILDGALSKLSATLTSLLGDVTALLLRILATDIRVLVEMEQKLVPGSKCTVTSYKVSRISGIRVLNLDLTVVANLVEGVLAPVLDLVLKLVVTGPIQKIFISELSQISIPLNYVRFL